MQQNSLGMVWSLNKTVIQSSFPKNVNTLREKKVVEESTPQWELNCSFLTIRDMAICQVNSRENKIYEQRNFQCIMYLSLSPIPTPEHKIIFYLSRWNMKSHSPVPSMVIWKFGISISVINMLGPIYTERESHMQSVQWSNETVPGGWKLGLPIMTPTLHNISEIRGINSTSLMQ